MKKLRLLAIFLTISLGTIGCQKADTILEDYMDEQEEIMDEMMDEMDSVQETENPSLDFVSGMIPHHEAAIEMAESYLKYAKEDSAFTQLAKDIITTQDREIGQMRDMIQTLKAQDQTDPKKSELYWEEYDQMMEQHHTSHKSNAKNLDAAFAEGMSMHHQMAIAMAKAILNYTEDETVRSFAQQIIEVQEKEIREMQTFPEVGSPNGHSH